jgi:hypothetical protein
MYVLNFLNKEELFRKSLLDSLGRLFSFSFVDPGFLSAISINDFSAILNSEGIVRNWKYRY